MNLLKRYLLGVSVILLGLLVLVGCNFNAHNAEMSIDAEKIMYIGAEYDFTVEVTEGALSDIEWSIDNTNVAKIEGNKIVPLQEGSFNLVAKMGDKTDVIHINVYVPDIYQITYVLNGGEGADLLQEFDRITVDKPVGEPTRLGYAFRGFFDNEELEGSIISTVSGSLKSDITLYAKWELLTIVMEYELNNGEAENLPQERTVLDEEVALPLASKEGYTFEGWYDNAEFSGEKVEVLNADNIMTSKLYAKFTPIAYELSYELNGGENGENPATYTVEDQVALAPATRNGYNFEGWELDGVKVEAIAKGSMGDKALVATWSLIEYPIEFELNGGAAEGLPTSRTIESEEIVLPEATKSAYNFIGWYDNAEFTGEPVTKLDASNLALTKLYAKFEVIDDDPTHLYVGEGQPYATINDAMAAAQDGYTIILVAGTHAGGTINKSVTLQGPNAGINPNTETRKAEAIVTSDIVIAADGVTIDGIQTTGVTRMMTTTEKDVYGLTITNVLVRGSTINVASGDSSTGPLYLVAGGAFTIYDAVITNCRFDEYNSGRPMIGFFEGIENLTIENNTFIGIYKTYNDGIKTNQTTRAAVKGNVSISYNYFQDFQQYVIWFRSYGAGNYKLEGNTFKHIGITTGSHAAFNFIKYMGESTDEFQISVKFNEIEQGMMLLRIDNTAAHVAEHVATVSYNKMTNCSGDYYIKNASKVTVNCDNNYWGTATPADSKFMGVASHTNDLASEDEVLTEEEVWLLGKLPVGEGKQYATLTEALAAAQDGDVIYLFPGTYAEEVTVDKAVTILGPNCDILGSGLRGEEAILTLPMVIAADNVTLKGLRFEGTATITVNANDATIENCYVQVTAVNPGSNNRKGMIISNVAISGLTLRGNYLYCGGYLQGPVDLCGVATNVVVDHNVFTNGITANNNVNEALLLYNAAGELTITNNEFLFPTDNWMILVYGSTLQHALIQDNLLNVANGVDHTSGIAIYNTPAACVVDFIHNKFLSTTGTTFRFTGGKAGATFNFYYNYFDEASPVKFNALGTIVANFQGNCYGTAINTATNLTPTDYQVYADYNLEQMEAAYLAWLNGPTVYTISYSLDGGDWPEGVEPLTELELDAEYTLPEPEREGFEFLGWFEGEQKVELCSGKNYVLVAHWEEILAVMPITIGEQGYRTIAAALAAAVDGDVIELAEGTFDFESVITKSVSFKGAGQDKSIIQFVQAENYNGLQAANISFESLTIKGRSANGTGTYFEIDTPVKKFTVKDCHVTMMNSFVKAFYATTDLEIEFIGNNFDNIGQFILWTKAEAGIKSITFVDNNVQTSNCLGVENGASSLVRVRNSNCVVHIYHNVFDGPFINGDGVCENGATNNEFEVRFNVFKNLNRYVHNNGGNAIIFNNNLYLDASGAALEAAPAALTGVSGVVGDEVLYATQDEVDAAYAEFLNGPVQPTSPFMIGSQGFETLADALAAAQDGDVIIVADGEYAETLTISKEVTIQGTHHDDVTENAAVLKGVLTIAADHVTLKDLAFTGAARVKSTTNDYLTFVNNYVHDTDQTTVSWVETNLSTLGFINVNATNDDQAKGFVISNNVFDKVGDSVIDLGRVDGATISHNTFTDFLYDAIRFDGGYIDGDIVITNNVIKQTANGGYNGIFMRAYGCHQGKTYSIVYIAGNRFENVGYASTSANFCGAIGVRNYQEYGQTFIIRENDFVNCKNLIRLRNNATAANHAAYAWNAIIEHNNFLGMPASYLYNCKTGSDGDSTNPPKAIIGVNFYGDASGNKVEVAEGLIKDYASLAEGADVPFEHGVVADAPMFVVTIVNGEEETRINAMAHGDVALPTLTKVGCDFVGFFLDASFEGTAFMELSTIEMDVTVYAKFVPTIYTLNYELNGGSFVEGAEIVRSGVYGQEIVLPLAEKEGLAFTGWVLEGSSNVITSVVLHSDTTVVATFARPIDENTLLVGTDKTYQTIGAALAQAHDGSIIIVDAGTYTEDFAIEVSGVTIIGANENIDPNSGSRVAETIISGSVAIVNNVNNVTFNGLKFTSPEALNMLGNNDNINLVYNVFESTYSGAGSASAPKMQVANSGKVSNFVVRNNRFILHSSYNYTCNIALVNEVENAEVVDNYFTNDCATSHNPFAVWFFSIAGHIEINNNMFDRFAGDYWTVWCGSSACAANTIIDFKDNVLDGRAAATNECGISFNNLTASGIQVNVIGNTFKYCKDTIIGIVGSGSSDSTSTPTVKIMYNAFISVSARMKFNCASTNFEFSNNYLSSEIGSYTDQGTPATKVNAIARDGYNSLEELQIAYQNYLNGVPNEYINVTYMLDGGSVTAPDKFLKGASFALATPTKEDYRFLGWTLTENGTEYITLIPNTQAEDLTVYAHWEKIVSSTVTFDFNGGYSEELFLLDVESAPHYAIDNYNYNEGTFWGGKYSTDVFIGNQGSDPKATFSDRIYIGKDLETGLYKIVSIIRSGGSSWPEDAEYVISISNSINSYYANYSPIAARLEVGMYACFSAPISSACKATPVTVGFFSGQPTQSTITKKVTSADTLLVPSRLGFEFDGWYDANNKKYNTVFDIDGDVTLIAHWTEKNPVTSIVIVAETAEMLTDEVFQFQAHVMPLDAYFQQIIYTSSDTNILTVDSTGKVKAINAGTASIFIKDYLGKFTVEKVITVYPVNTLEVHTENPFKGSLAPAEEVVLLVDLFGKQASSATYTFTSSNDNVLVVNNDGKVTGVADGTAVVTIESVELGAKVEMSIMVRTENPNAQGVDQLLDLLIDNHMNIIETGNVCLYNDGRQKVFTPTYGSVNRYLFDEFVVDTTYYATSEANPNNHKVRRTGEGYDDSIYFVTVHDTATLTGTVVSIASGMSSGETSIHYTVGNDAIYGVVPEQYIAYHAGDGTGVTFRWTNTGVPAADPTVAPEYDVVKVDDKFYLTCNGVQTTIEVPMMDTAEPDKDRYTILGPVWKVEDGVYYVGGPLWYSYSQIGTRGGNNNSIGIEMCVNYSSDVYDTWQRTAQLVADICLRNGLDTTRVKMHNTWSGKNCPQCLIEGGYWWEFMEMVELQYAIQKDFAGAEISIESHNPEILDNTGRIIAAPQTTTVVSYDLTVKYGGQTRTVTLSSVVTGTTCWEQWDGTYVASTVWNGGKYNRY